MDKQKFKLEQKQYITLFQYVQCIRRPPPQPGKKSTLKLDMFLHCNFNILRILGKNRHGLNKNNLENLTKNKQKQKKQKQTRKRYLYDLVFFLFSKNKALIMTDVQIQAILHSTQGQINVQYIYLYMISLKQLN